MVPVRGGQHLILSAGVQTIGGRWDISLVQIPCGEPAQVWTSMNQSQGSKSVIQGFTEYNHRAHMKRYQGSQRIQLQ